MLLGAEDEVGLGYGETRAEALTGGHLVVPFAGNMAYYAVSNGVTI